MDKEELKNYLSKGSEIAGGAVGGAIGLIGGPAGAVLGGTLGAAFVIGIKEVINRQLSNRQEMRVAASAAYALTGTQHKLESGMSIRTDDFFDNSVERSSAEELFEGILLKCKDQYQEKKIPYISKIFEQTIFDVLISAELANQILSIAESFTYRRLCIIAYFGRLHEFDHGTTMKDPYALYKEAVWLIELEMILQDICDLAYLGVVQNSAAIFTRHDLIPATIQITPLGNTYISVMGLTDIPVADLTHIHNELQYREEFGPNEYGTRNQGPWV
nr:hypothetical protein [Pedobacter panaciterrae]